MSGGGGQGATFPNQPPFDRGSSGRLQKGGFSRGGGGALWDCPLSAFLSHRRPMKNNESASDSGGDSHSDNDKDSFTWHTTPFQAVTAHCNLNIIWK